MQGEVMEVPVIDDYKNIYTNGDIVLFSVNTGISQPYNGQSCLWLNAKGYPDGDIISIVTETN